MLTVRQNRRTRRRTLANLGWLLLGLFAPSLAVNGQEPPNTEHDTELRVMSIDWTQTATLLALGVTPIASPQQSDYHDWVGEPQMPGATQDIGLRVQPNLELIAELAPERIFISPRFSSHEPQLSRIAPITTVGLYKVGEVDWEAMIEFTQTLAEHTDTFERAETLITQTEQKFAQWQQTLATKGETPPLLVIQFMDPTHVRVFGTNSMYNVAMRKLGLRNAWQDSTNSWGFALVGVDKLQGVQGQIVIVEPKVAGVENHLATDRYWQYLVEQTGYPVLTVAPTWSFGALPSTTRFGDLLTQALTAEVSL
uniref:ABC transporter substrate-binding protein n=1 Tax=Thaumasiovibrio occultus TaxID=1891184 RepID=UPI000B34D6D2|nr:ABC transporter substrate-binding protein [Thaumasiovibrio occultus]